MVARIKYIIGVVLIALLLGAPLSGLGLPQANAVTSYEFAEVKIGKSDAFMVTDSDAETAAERATDINRRIMKILLDPASDPSRIDVLTLPGGNQAVALDDDVIVSLGQKDVQIFGRPQNELASAWAAILRTRITQLKPLYQSHKKTTKTEGSSANKNDSMSKPLADEKIMLFLIQVSILLSSALICGEILARLGQPAVIGQLLAGIILGPSVFGAVFPTQYESVFPVESTQQYLIDIVSWLGVIFLLMLTGTETDLGLIKAQGKVAIATSVGAIVLPLLCGFAVAFALPVDMLVLPDQRLVLGAFIGTVFSVSSITVIAKILMDMKLLRRNIGQAILASALVQDLGGCILLAVVAAIAGGSHGGSPMALLKLPLGMLAFALFGATIGKKLIFNLFRWAQDRSHVDYASISLVIVCLLLSSAITQFIGVHVILGAFAIGVLLAQSPLVGQRVLHPLEAVTMGIFAPVFFAAAGLHVNLTLLRDPKLLLIAVAVTVVACFSKILGAYLGGLSLKMDMWESLSIGFGTNARGSMGLIVGILGFSLGILTVDLFTVIVLMSLVSTGMAPFLLKYSLGKTKTSAEEIDRLGREEKQAHSFVNRIHRLLLPVKAQSKRNMTGRLISALGKHHAIEATAFAVHGTSMKEEEFLSKTLLERSKEGNVTLINRAIQSDSPSKEIASEAKLNYDLIVLESTRMPTENSVFGPTIDEVAQAAPCPLLIVRESSKKDNWDVKRILLPTTGRSQNSQAAELGVLLAKSFGATVIALCVEEQKNISYKSLLEDVAESKAAAREIVEQVTALADAFGVESDAIVSVASDPANEILRVVKEQNVDLVVLAARVRPTRRLYLGNTVRILAEKLPCHMAILSPEGVQ